MRYYAQMLYVVATPIGNLKDMTLRAIETLKTVDLILSEDTRETDKILREFGIEKQQISYRDQNHNKIIDYLIEQFKEGKTVALVSDSGTPLISDPGYKLVHDLRERGIMVESIPGPSAIISALSISGLPTDKFIFLGFLPKSLSKRKELLKKYGETEATLTIYESPYRVRRLLHEIQEALGERKIFIAKDLTKIHEKTFYGNLSELISNEEQITEKGEYMVLISKSEEK